MLRARDVLHLSRRFRSALTKAESDVIFANIFVIVCVELVLGAGVVHSVLARWLGSSLCAWLYAAGNYSDDVPRPLIHVVRAVLFLFGMNVIWTAQRVARRLLAQIEAQPTSSARVPPPKPSGPKYLIVQFIL